MKKRPGRGAARGLGPEDAIIAHIKGNSQPEHLSCVQVQSSAGQKGDENHQLLHKLRNIQSIWVES